MDLSTNLVSRRSGRLKIRITRFRVNGHFTNMSEGDVYTYIW